MQAFLFLRLSNNQCAVSDFIARVRNAGFFVWMICMVAVLPVPGLSQGPQFELAASENVFIVGAHDFDQDGDPDLLNGTPIFSGYYLGWLENDGMQNFRRFHGARYAGSEINGSTIFSIEVHDVDLDGDLDVLAIRSGSLPVLQVYENRDGAFHYSAMTLPCAGYLFADAENEGQPSLYVASGLQLHRVWFSSGQFSTEVRFTATSANADRIHEPRCADFNGDGANDVAFILDDNVPANPGQDAVVAIYNTSEPNWTTTTLFTGQQGTSWSQIITIAIADADSDGDPDIYHPAIGSVRLRLNNGSGSFVTTCNVGAAFNPTSRKLFAVGQDNAGLPDFVNIPDAGTANPVPQLYRNVGCTMTGSAENGYLPFMADMNGDGNSDLLQAAFAQSQTPFTINLWTGDGNGVFASSGQQLTVHVPSNLLGSIWYAAADIDQSGWSDIVGFENDQPILFTLDEDGVLVTRQTMNNSVNQPSVFFVTADMNGDGWPDAIHGASDTGNNNWPRDIYIRWNNNGNLDAAPVQVYNNTGGVTVQLWGLNTGDMDGDGDNDILFYNNGQGVRMLRNLGNGSFSAPITITSDFAVDRKSALNIIDLDGDGQLDFSIYGRHYRNAGNTVFNLMYTVTNKGRTCAYPDLNGDGLPDLVSHQNPEGTTQVYLNSNNTSMSLVHTLSGQELAEQFTVIDADGDGRDEVFTGRHLYRWNNGSFELIYTLPIASNAYSGQTPDGGTYLFIPTPEVVFLMRDFVGQMGCLLSQPVVSEDYDVLQVNAQAGTLQWWNCGTNQAVVGETSGTFAVPLSGSYSLYYNIAGCEGMTPCIQVNIVPGDFNNDDVVTSLDFLTVIANFGCAFANCGGDVNEDGIVTVQDIIILMTMLNE
ncbi:MAG: FG-GAP-like repeat-containing protein [Flavobacteriales bacterium]